MRTTTTALRKAGCFIVSLALAAALCPLPAFASQAEDEGTANAAAVNEAAQEETAAATQEDGSTDASTAAANATAEADGTDDANADAPEAAAAEEDAANQSSPAEAAAADPAELAPLSDDDSTPTQDEPTAIALTNSMVSLAYTETAYTGNACKPAVKVVANGTTLTRGTDYKVSYANNVKVGTATVTVTAKGSTYTGSATATFAIKKVAVAQTTYVVKKGTAKKYTATFGKACGPTAAGLSDRTAITKNAYTSGMGLKLTGISGKVKYRVYADGKWSKWKTKGIAGSTSKGKSIQGIQVKLSGAAAKKYTLYYRVNVFGCDWMGWTTDGKTAGPTANSAMKIRSVQMQLVPKGEKAPGTTKFHTFGKSKAEDYYKYALQKKIANLSSDTQYCISVSTEFNRIAVFKGEKGNWKMIKYGKCGTGKASHATGHANLLLPGKRGTHFGESKGYTCWYWTKIYKAVRFHSVLYKKHSKSHLKSRLSKQVGSRVSHGCVRLPKAFAKWIYENAQGGTRVRIS